MAIHIIKALVNSALPVVNTLLYVLPVRRRAYAEIYVSYFDTTYTHEVNAETVCGIYSDVFQRQHLSEPDPNLENPNALRMKWCIWKGTSRKLFCPKVVKST